MAFRRRSGKKAVRIFRKTLWLTRCAGAGFALLIPVLNEAAVQTPPLPACSPVGGPVTFAARQIVAGAILLLRTLLLFVLFGASEAAAEVGHLAERLTPEVMAIVWPGAEKLGPEGGKPSATPVHRDGQIAGYLFS